MVLAANVAPLQGVMLITVTAPGTDAGMAWDPDACTHPPGETCSGPKGCRVVKRAADRWHEDMQERWSKLHRTCAAVAARQTGRGPIVAAYAWEPQERGLYHRHIVVPFHTPRERARAQVYLAALKERAPAAWFGFVDGSKSWAGENGGRRAAGYCAKYIGKTTAEAALPGIRRPIYVGAFLTTRSGVTMRFCRLRRFSWHLVREGLVDARDHLAAAHFDPLSLPVVVSSALARAP